MDGKRYRQIFQEKSKTDKFLKNLSILNKIGYKNYINLFELLSRQSKNLKKKTINKKIPGICCREF